MKINLKQIVQWTGAKVLSEVNKEFHGLGTDTRQDLSGQLFVALQGDLFDAHAFLSQAVKQNASALLVHKKTEELDLLKDQVTIFLVDDTLRALQDLAHHYRKTMKAKILGITGSNGKTTTKEFAAAIISTVKKTHYSKGSFNNHWGVPLTLLALEEDHEIAVVEMGMNHAGEITRLVEIADPDIVTCTMVGRAHIEHFGTVEKIAEAKEEIYNASRTSAVRIYNLDNPHTFRMFQKAVKFYPKSTKLTFSSMHAKADLYLRVKTIEMDALTIEGKIAGQEGTARVPVFGEHNLNNLSAAAGLALAAGLSPQQIWKGLSECKTNWGRNQWLETEGKAKILFDGYNANPDSMKALLSNVSQLQVGGKKIGVFAQMLELGDVSAELHEELGQLVAESGFDRVYFYGQDHQAFSKGFLKSQADIETKVLSEFKSSLADDLLQSIQANDLVVVKGSRGMKLERMILPLKPIGFSEKKE